MKALTTSVLYDARWDPQGKLPIRVYLENSKGGFSLWSRHSSGTAAQRSFRTCTRQWPTDKIFVMDARTGERKQYDGKGVTTGPFRTTPEVAWMPVP